MPSELDVAKRALEGRQEKKEREEGREEVVSGKRAIGRGTARKIAQRRDESSFGFSSGWKNQKRDTDSLQNSSGPPSPLKS